MLKGTCHCGAVAWTLAAQPNSATACNCTICRRYGTLRAYGYIGETVHTTGNASTYQRRDSGDLGFHFCAVCGCVTHYIATASDEDGRKLAAVNLRMSELSAISDIPIRHFDGHDSFKALPRDGRTVTDMWF